ncbi:hypothetical protein [Bacillus mycoides]|uniref:hypothetical protein n=1 Tax=Bacillus mycoides TaxID=1405 RepID=UPI0036E6AF4D
MVDIGPMCGKETCNPNNEGIDIDFCDKCMMLAIEGAALHMSVPNSLREKMTINSYGRLHEVYKDEWMREFNKERGFGIQSLRNSTK